MQQSEQYFEELIRSYLAGRATEAESVELTEWLQADDRHRELFRACVRESCLVRSGYRWEEVDTCRAKTDVFRRLDRRPAFRRFMAYAAVCMLILGGALILYLQAYREAERDYASPAVRPYRQQVVLSIGDERQVLLDGNGRVEIAGGRGEQVAVADNNQLDYRVFADAAGDSVRRHTLTVPRGSEFCVTLGDGTRVWMNAMSELSYPEVFTGALREVTLSGEAYFEVAPRAEQPFVVHTREMRLEVLGTSFNIRAYPEESYLSTTLVTGKIRQRYPSTGQVVTLSPHEQACFDLKQHRLYVGEADLMAVLAWKEGRILLRDGTLEEIFDELSRWYDFEVSYQSESLRKMRFYLNIDRYADVGSVLEKLQRTRGIRFVIRGKEILVCDDVK